jgi:2-methylaconitate isomerase
MSYLHFDRNLEQIVVPITIIRGGTSRGFFFERSNVPKPGEGLEEFLLAVRGSPDPMGMDGLGGNSILQSKAAIVSPSSRPGADVDYTFIQIFPDQPAGITYNVNCGNIAAGVPVFALMKNLIPDVPDGRVTVRAFSTNTRNMMYITLDVLHGEARVQGTTRIAGVPGTGSEIRVDFREQGGGFTGKLFPTGNFIDSIPMDDGTTVDVTVMDLVNVCTFFDASKFGIGCTGLEIPDPDGKVVKPQGMEERITELRLKVARRIGWDQYTRDSVRKVAAPIAVSVTPPATYLDLCSELVKAQDLDLVARFYAESILHTAAPGSGATTLAAAALIPGTIPNTIMAECDLKSGKGGRFTFGHPSGLFSVTCKPILSKNPNDIRFTELSFPLTARIICDGMVYVKYNHPTGHPELKVVDEISGGSFFPDTGKVKMQK